MDADNEDESDQTSGDENGEKLEEIEAKLYSIIHYNDLTKPLDESITSLYNIEINESQEIVVSLKEEQGEHSDGRKPTDFNISTSNLQDYVPVIVDNNEPNVEKNSPNKSSSNLQVDNHVIIGNNELNIKKKSSSIVSNQKDTDFVNNENNFQSEKRFKIFDNVDLKKARLYITRSPEHSNTNNEIERHFNQVVNKSKKNNKSRKRKQGNETYNKIDLPCSRNPSDLANHSKHLVTNNKKMVQTAIRSSEPIRASAEFILKLDKANSNNDNRKCDDAVIVIDDEDTVSVNATPEPEFLGPSETSVHTSKCVSVIDIANDDDCKIVEVVNHEKEIIDGSNIPTGSNTCGSREDCLVLNTVGTVSNNSNVLYNECEVAKLKPTSHSERTCSKSKKISKSKIKRIRKDFQCPKKWTSSMVKFYNSTSKRRLNFNEKDIRGDIKDKKPNACWFVSPRDINPQSIRKKVRCGNCRQFDHLTKHCPDPKREVICHMCGGKGHIGTRCPKKQCLTCGAPNQLFVEMCSKCISDISNKRIVCNICGSLRHKDETCPDVWRAFHMTTKDGPIVVPYRDGGDRKFCSQCGGNGHLNHECNSTYRNSPFSLLLENEKVKDYSQVASLYSNLRRENKMSISLHLNDDQAKVLSSKEGDKFLQELSNSKLVVLELEDNILTIKGSQKQYYSVCPIVNNFFLCQMDRSSSSSRPNPPKRSKIN